MFANSAQNRFLKIFFFILIINPVFPILTRSIYKKLITDSESASYSGYKKKFA